MAGQFFSSQPSADLPSTSFLTPDVTPGAQEMSRQAFLQNNPAIAAQIAAQRSAQDSQTNDAVDNRAIRLQNQQMFPNLASSYKPVGNEQVSDPIIARKIALSDRDIAANSPMNPIDQAVQAVQAARAQSKFPVISTSDPDAKLKTMLAPYLSPGVVQAGGGSLVGSASPNNPFAILAKLKQGEKGIGQAPDYSFLTKYIKEETGDPKDPSTRTDIIEGMPKVNTIAYDPHFQQLMRTNPAAANEIYTRIRGGATLENDYAGKSTNPITNQRIKDAHVLAQHAIQSMNASVDTEMMKDDKGVDVPKNPKTYGRWMGVMPSTEVGLTSKERVLLNPDFQNALDMHAQIAGTFAPMVQLRKRGMALDQSQQKGIDDALAAAAQKRGQPVVAPNAPTAPVAPAIDPNAFSAPGQAEAPNSPYAAQAAAIPNASDIGVMAGSVGQDYLRAASMVGNAYHGIANRMIQGTQIPQDIVNNIIAGHPETISQMFQWGNPKANPLTAKYQPKAENFIDVNQFNNKSDGQGRTPQDMSQASPRMLDPLLQSLQNNPKFREIYHKDPDQAKAVLEQYQIQAAAQAAQ